MQNEFAEKPFPPPQVKALATEEEEAPKKSALQQQMENAWNEDDDKDMDVLANDTMKKQ